MNSRSFNCELKNIESEKYITIMTLEAVHTDDLAGTGGNNTEGEVVASDKLEFDSADRNLAIGYEVNDRFRGGVIEERASLGVQGFVGHEPEGDAVDLVLGLHR